MSRPKETLPREQAEFSASNCSAESWPYWLYDYELNVDGLGEDELAEAKAQIRFLKARILAMKEKGYLRLRAAARVMGSRGGVVGGPRRAQVLSPERRKEIASLAARTRWKKLPPNAPGERPEKQT